MPEKKTETYTKARPSEPLRVLLVANSDIVGKRVHEALDKQPDITITSQATDGVSAVSAMRRVIFDVIVVDIGQTGSNAMVTVSRILKVDPAAKIVMVGSLSFNNVKISMRVLMEGAAAFIPTPAAHTKTTSELAFSRDLLENIRAFERSERELDHRLKPSRVDISKPRLSSQPQKPIELRPAAKMVPDVLAVGSSTGGPQALFTFIATLPQDFDLPIMITQHMPATFTTLLASHITKNSSRECHEGVNGEPIKRGRLYLAPGDQHMIAVSKNGIPHIQLNDDEPVNFCRPSVDPMLDSLTEVYNGKVLTVILTGMGADGCKSAIRLVEKGGIVVAQDQETCVVWGMPRAVAEAGICSAILPIDELAPFVGKLAKPGW